MTVLMVEGSDEFLIEAEIQSLYARNAALVRVNIDAGSSGADGAIKDATGTSSFFRQPKLVVVYDANKVDGKFLAKYCENPNREHTMVLIPSSGRLPKWFKEIKYDDTIKCDPLKPWEYKDWILKFCRSKGYTIDAGIADAIHANVGDDLFAIANELEKVFLLISPRQTITGQDVSSVLVPHTEVSPIKILQAWSAKQTPQAVRTLTMFFGQKGKDAAALPVIALLLTHIERKISFLSLSNSGISNADICAALSISPYILEQVRRDAHPWTLQQLRRAYSTICAIESKVKRGYSGFHLLTWFLTQKFEEDVHDF